MSAHTAGLLFNAPESSSVAPRKKFMLPLAIDDTRHINSLKVLAHKYQARGFTASPHLPRHPLPPPPTVTVTTVLPNLLLPPPFPLRCRLPSSSSPYSTAPSAPHLPGTMICNLFSVLMQGVFGGVVPAAIRYFRKRQKGPDCFLRNPYALCVTMKGHKTRK
jgi:hypothetical protein